jgi:dCMP deaminase
MMENDHCVATIHAEANAIIQAAKNGVMIDGAAIYVTASPCWNCFKQIANAGIRRIVYGEFYRDERIFSVAERLGMELLHIPSHVAQATPEARRKRPAEPGVAMCDCVAHAE